MFLFSMRTPSSLPSAFSRHQKRFVLPDSFHEILIPSFILNETNRREALFFGKNLYLSSLFLYNKSVCYSSQPSSGQKGAPMPKIFTDEEKEGHRAILLDQGLGLIMKNGYKNVTIDQLVQLIGASKGYFYVLFPSKEQFFLQAIASQMERHFDALREVMERHPSPKEIGEAYRLLFKNIHFASFEDVLYVQQKISDAEWQHFRDFEEEFFTRILTLLGRDTQKCDPRLLSNLSAFIFLCSNSRGKYLFLEKINDLVDILLGVFHAYIFPEDDAH